jgi:hypothetical protein
MISQSFALAVAAAALVAATAAAAQTPEPPAATEPPAAAEPAAAEPVAEQASPCCAIAAMTEVEIEVAERMTSKISRQGQKFAIRLAEPIVVDGRIVVPAGTPGVGEVVHSAKAGGAGRGGELILAARYLELDGQRIPLRSFRYGRRQGKDKSGAVNTGNMVAAAVLPAASLVGFLVKGGEVDIPAGTRANAKVSATTSLPPRD